MKDDGLAVVLFVVIIGGGVALAIATDISGPACVAARLQSIGTKDFDFGCLEFWLNRYQSLLGNLLTAAVTGAALFWAAGQLVAANRQAATSAATALRVRVNELEQELAALDRVSEIAGLASATILELSYNRDIERFRTLKRSISMIWEELRTQRSKIQGWSRANRTVPSNEVRLAYISALDDIGLPIAHCFHSAVGLSDYNSLTDDDLRYFKKIQATAVESFPRFFPAGSNFRLALEREISATWDQIRKFEAAAVQDRPMGK